MSEPKLYKKFKVIRVSTGIEETEDYVSLRLSKEIKLDLLIEYLKMEIWKLSPQSKPITWKDVEVALLKSEIEE